MNVATLPPGGRRILLLAVEPDGALAPVLQIDTAVDAIRLARSLIVAAVELVEIQKNGGEK
jgi:hypothetical protein